VIHSANVRSLVVSATRHDTPLALDVGLLSRCSLAKAGSALNVRFDYDHEQE
jgi:hypothetical protein